MKFKLYLDSSKKKSIAIGFPAIDKFNFYQKALKHCSWIKLDQYRSWIKLDQYRTLSDYSMKLIPQSFLLENSN